MTNEAAERLLKIIADGRMGIDRRIFEALQDALDTERRATVERIECAIRIVADAEQYDLRYAKEVKRLAKDVAAILDAEAQQ